MNTYIVDRIEGDFFVLETEEKTHIHVPKEKVSKEAKEGSVLNLSENGLYDVNADETSKRRQKLFRLQDTLFSE